MARVWFVLQSSLQRHSAAFWLPRTRSALVAGCARQNLHTISRVEHAFCGTIACIACLSSLAFLVVSCRLRARAPCSILAFAPIAWASGRSSCHVCASGCQTLQLSAARLVLGLFTFPSLPCDCWDRLALCLSECHSHTPPFHGRST